MTLEFFGSVDFLGKFFWICALCGTLYFILRVILMFIGADGDADFDVNFDASDAAFDFLSINTVTAFIMMFGWSGLTCYIQFTLQKTQSIIIAFIVGILSMLITAYMFQQAKKLVSHGSQFHIKKTIGLTATVYQRIPAEGKGKISVTIPGDLIRELDAISADKVEIESQSIVKVINAIDTNTLSVKKIS